MILVDLGCFADTENEESIRELIAAYGGGGAGVEAIYGFDPRAENADYEHDGVLVHVRGIAAWTYDGCVSFTENGVRSHIGGEHAPDVNCFDFARWLQARGPAVVKMDVEGAEYAILAHLWETGTIGLVEQLIVEWHGCRSSITKWWK